MAKKWVKFPSADKAYVHDAAGLKKHWARLHKGDCEPLPKDAGALDAWAAFHAGEQWSRRAAFGPLYWCRVQFPPMSGSILN